MPDDLPGPPAPGNRDDTPGDRPPGYRSPGDNPPGDRPTEPLGTPSPQPPPPPVEPPAPVEPASPAAPPPAGQTWPQAPPPAQDYGQQGYAPPYGGQPGYGQQPGYGPPPYGAPPGAGYGYPQGPPTDSSATAALVIAIIGFFICPPVGAIVALVLANSAQKRIEASNGQLGGLEMAKAARIIAIIELALTAVLLVAGLIAIAASLGSSY
jgi:hypothetical protein